MNPVSGFQEHGWLPFERLMAEVANAGARLAGMDQSRR
jgi:hypothetical protein